MRATLGTVAIVVVAAAGCRPSSFECATDAECVDAGVEGVCQPSHVCSFPDELCTSGQRYGEFAGVDAGECVPPEPEGTGDGSSGIASGPTSTQPAPTTAGSGADASADASAEATSNTATDGTGAGTGATPTDTGDTGEPPVTDRYLDCDDPLCDHACASWNDYELCALPCPNEVCPVYVDPSMETYPMACINVFVNICAIPCRVQEDCPGDTLCGGFAGQTSCVYPA